MPVKSMLITGTRKGIGRYLAEYYINKDYCVFGCSRGSIDFENENYRHFIGDVSDENFVISMCLAIRQQGGIDYLINNAGIASMNHAILTPKETIEKILATNVIGTFLLARESIKIMHVGGRVINFSTVASPLALEGEAIYAASKSAVEKLTQILAKEIALRSITVNTIGPTPIDTDLIAAIPKEKIDILLSKQAIKRMGKYEDIANVVDFFLREESNFITGQTLFLGGVFHS